MKAIFWYWNLMHYNLYVCYKHAHWIFDYINPFKHLFKLPFIKNFYSKHGVNDMNKFVDNEIFNSPVTGINIIWSGIQMGGIFIFMEYAIFNLLQGFIGIALIKIIWENKIYSVLFILVLLGLAGLFNYYTLFKNDRYLNYIYEFEKIPRDKRIRYGWSCFMVLILILFFMVISFSAVPNL